MRRTTHAAAEPERMNLAARRSLGVVVGWMLRQALWGRQRDPDAPRSDPAARRFTRSDGGRIRDRTLDWYELLMPVADLERIPTRGNRLNVRLAVMTMALYRALLDEGVEPDRAAALVGDAGWIAYEAGAWPFVLLARLRHRDPHRRLVFALRVLLHFPFSAPGHPGYEVKTEDTGDAFLTTWTSCPPQTFVRDLVEMHGDHGELEAFRRSWCAYDWQFNDLLGEGRGDYRRPHTLSEDDDCCDMRWAVHAVDQQTRVAVSGGQEARAR